MRGAIYFLLGAANLAYAIAYDDAVCAFFAGALLAFALTEAEV